MYALDTNMVIYFFKGMGSVAHRLLNTPPKHIAIPSVVLFELEVGIVKSPSPQKRSRQLIELLKNVSILDFGRDAARYAAGIRAELEKKGTPIGPFDTLIAATALSNQATLVTRNTREFERISGLVLEDWF